MQAWRALAEAGKLTGPPARYFEPRKPMEELYDVVADPHQLHNLAGEPRHAAALHKYRAECGRWMTATGDLGLLPEYEMHQRAHDRPFYEMTNNPLPALLMAARLANAIQPTNAPQLVKLLTHADPALRWWGAVGLVALGKNAQSGERTLRQALTDSAPEVRIAAAEAIGNLGDDATALPVLVAALQHDSEFVRLAALNVLDRFGMRARPALAAIRAAGMERSSPVTDYVNRMVEYLPAWIESGKRGGATNDSAVLKDGGAEGT